MSENKFIRHLQGKDTAKSVLEIRNQNTPTSFANMPEGTSNANDVYSDRRGDAAGVLKGTENWKLNNSLLIETSTVYGDGRDFTDDFEVGGSGLWVNATCTFTTARRFAPNTKFVLKLCGHDLDTVVEQTVGFTLIVKFGSTVITKVFSVPVQAFDFCKEFEIDFGESNSSAIKVAANSTMQVQLLCADANAQATIYNGMTVFTALQRRVDSETVSSDTLSLDEIETDLTTHIANKNNPHEVTKAQVGLGNCDNTSDKDKPISTDTQKALDGKVSKTGDTMDGRYILEWGSRFSFISNTNNRFDTLANSSDEFTVVRWYNNSYSRGVLFKANTAGAALYPAADSAHTLGLGGRRWQRIYVKEICGDGLGSYILTPPEKSGIIATKADVDLAANSGRMITDEGVWYAKMDPNSTVPSYAEVEGRNYADFTQVDGDNNPIIVVYTYTSGAWDNGTTVVPPAEYDGYVPVTAKIWDIADQVGQQGGRILWNHQSGEFTPYPQIISFEDIEVTGDSTVVMPQNPGANQIVNKDYVDEAIAAIPTPTVDVTQSIDAEIVGALTINDSVVSNFSGTNYLELPGVFELGDSNVTSFEIGGNFTTSSDTTHAHVFFESANPLSGYGSVGIAMYISATNILTAHIIGNLDIQIITGVTSLSPNTKYYIKLEYDGTNYKLWLSTDGLTYDLENSAVATESPTRAVFRLGKTGYPVASIDMSGWYIKENNRIIWSGMDSVGLNRRAVTGHEVIEFQAPTSSNNYTWYRKYADGWVEMGGSIDSASGTYTVTFPVTMADTHYTILKTLSTTSSNNVQYSQVSFFNKTTTSAETSTAGVGFTWQVSGMAA